MIRAGELRQRVTLEKPAETVASGEPTIPWTTVATVRAKMEGLSGSDRTGLVADAAIRFTIYHRTDVTARWRLGLVGTTRKFQLVSPPIDPDGLGRELVLLTQEMTA